MPGLRGPVLAILLAPLLLAAERPQQRVAWRKRVATDTYAFRITPADDCTGAALAGTAAETITFTRATSATCVKNDGTLTTLSSGQPRVNGSGLLTEAATTNLLTNSEEQAQNGLGWQFQNLTRSAVAAPSGASAGWTITDDSTNGQHRTWQAATVVDATVHTNSIYAKAGTASFLGMWSNAGTSAAHAVFNLSTGVVAATSNATAVITAVGSAWPGWYRCSITFTSNTTTEYHTINMGTTQAQADAGSYVGSGSTILIAASQLETGSVPTSYVKTLGTQVTRNADVVTVSTVPTAWPIAQGEVTVRYTPDWSLLPVLRPAFTGRRSRLGPRTTGPRCPSTQRVRSRSRRATARRSRPPPRRTSLGPRGRST
jgi:hypothetical protein